MISYPKWSAAPPDPLFSGSETGEAGMVTYHRFGGVQITAPSHGLSGWHDGEVLIWNGKYLYRPGWYRLDDYRRLKVIATGKPDYRLTSPPTPMDLVSVSGPVILRDTPPSRITAPDEPRPFRIRVSPTPFLYSRGFRGRY